MALLNACYYIIDKIKNHKDYRLNAYPLMLSNKDPDIQVKFYPYACSHKNLPQTLVTQSRDKYPIYKKHSFEDLAFDNYSPQSAEYILHWIKSYGNFSQDSDLSAQVWDPYLVSVRIVNWIKWLTTNEDAHVEVKFFSKKSPLSKNQSQKDKANLELGGITTAPLSGNGGGSHVNINDDLDMMGSKNFKMSGDHIIIVESLLDQIRYLNRYIMFHRKTNELFMSARALIAAGLFFNGHEAEVWRNKGEKLLQTCLSEYHRQDGHLAGLSVAQQAILAGGLLDLIHIANIYAYQLPEELFATLSSMLKWLHYVSHPNGRIAFCENAIDTPLGLGELMEYVAILGCPPIDKPSKLVSHLGASGYCCMKSHNWALITRIGQVDAEHIQHSWSAGNLAFELSYKGTPLLSGKVHDRDDVGFDRYENEVPLSYAKITPNVANGQHAQDHSYINHDKNFPEVGNFVGKGNNQDELNINKSNNNKTISSNDSENSQESTLSVTAGNDPLFRKNQHKRSWSINKDSVSIVDQSHTSKAVILEYAALPGTTFNHIGQSIWDLNYGQGLSLRLDFGAKCQINFDSKNNIIRLLVDPGSKAQVLLSNLPCIEN